MSTPVAVRAGTPTLRIGGTAYPVLLPTVRDPRLHLAAVIVSLQVLGQTSFDFGLSIAQILIALLTCAVLEVGIAAWRQRAIVWPASALLTGNGVAFVLRVPGTRHGDWWSTRGWWIFAGTAAVSLLSKYVVRLRGRHLFNPSNFGLLLCFLVLGSKRADPLDFWWAPMSLWLALAFGIIVVGGLALLLRLHLLGIAVGFWLAFAAGIGVLSLSGHAMTARWHLGPITGGYFWWLLVSSPEILVFLFFMITDPKTIPGSRSGRRVYAVSVGLLAALLIAPQRTEFWSKVALLGSLALVCAARPLVERLPSATHLVRGARSRVGATALAGAAVFVGMLLLAGIPAHTGAGAASPPLLDTSGLPQVTVISSKGVASKIDRRTALRMAHDVVADLGVETDALSRRDLARAAVGAGGDWLEELRSEIRGAAGHGIVVPSYRVERMRVTLEPGVDQGPPKIVATLTGVRQLVTYATSASMVADRSEPVRFEQTFELGLVGGRYLIVAARGAAAKAPAAPTAEASSSKRPSRAAAAGFAGVRLKDVAGQVGLHFRQGSFRFGVSNDVTAMMGGGVCWLDYDNDGWLDLFAVNSYANSDFAAWASHGGLPRSALFRNVHGRFVDVSRTSHANLAVQGDGCVAADFNGDGHTDLLVTTAVGMKLLWNDGDGTFTEGGRAAGLTASGWYAGAAVSDVNGDGRPDLFVAGYTDLNSPVPGSAAGFPTNYTGVRDLLYLNEGPDRNGRSRFREVGVQAGLEAARFSHGLGAVFTDYNGDGRPDLYVANDEDPDQLYENVAWPGGAKADPAGLGFRFEERGATEGVADPYAGMGIASADYSGDGRTDLFVTNSRREPDGIYRSSSAVQRGPSFVSGHAGFASALGTSSAGWGASWVDLNNDGNLDLVLANAGIPVTNLADDAAPVQVLENLSAEGQPGQFASVGSLVGLGDGLRLNGRGLAAGDFDNDGSVDIAINTIGGPLVLLRSSGGRGHWLEVKLDRFSPGVKVTAVLPDGRRLVREAQAGSSYLTSEDPRLHFGLGGATKVSELIVRYPGGSETLRDVASDRIVGVELPRPRVRSVVEPQSYLIGNCVPNYPKGVSAAHVWDEAALAAIRSGLVAPTTAARNLFHLSAAMWDAWAAYDPKADGYFVTEKDRATDVLAARETAISYAAYRILLWRASYGANMEEAFQRLTATMRSLCYSPDFTSTKGDSPAALGNRIAAAAIKYGLSDGSLEQQHYVDPSFTPVNSPLVVSQAGASMRDATFWQPLALGLTAVQSPIPVPAKVQTFVGAQWGHLRGFALSASAKGLPIDPGAPPIGTPTDLAYKRAAVDVIRQGLLSDRSARAVAGFWADGPASPTAPGRWNAIANSVSDSPRLAARIGSGAANRLRWDVELYFGLNGALHDAAIAAWGAKRTYQAVRPISMIRYMAFQGQSSDRKAASYNAEGLPLVPGLIELITKESSAPGQRQAGLAAHVGEIAIRTWRGWVLGSRWTPYLPTPSFPGWVSDASAFGGAAAEVLTADSGSRAFPPGFRWPTYDSAADQEGLADLYGGIDIAADERAGLRVGAAVGNKALSLADRYFAGTIRRG